MPLEVFNQLCIFPKTKWGIKLSNSGSSVAPSALNTEETIVFTSNIAATVSGILYEVFRDIITSAHSKKAKILSCSEFPASLEQLLAEKNTTLDKLAGLKARSICHYGIEAMVEDAYTRSLQTSMDYKDLPLADGTLGGTVFAMHNSLLLAQWVTSYLVDTDNDVFMDDVRAQL